MNEFLNTWITGLNSIGQGFCNSAAAMFLQVSVLVAGLFVLDVWLRRHLRATVRYWIWMLVIIKLLLPPTFSLPTGVGHWVGQYVALPAPVARQVPGTPGPHEILERPLLPDTAGRTSAPPLQQPNAGGMAATDDPISVRGEHLTWQGGALLLWGIGVLAFAIWVIRRALFVGALMARGRPAEGGPIDLLEECRRRMRIGRQVRLKLLPGAFSPAVCGLWRPTILLPETLPVRLSPGNLRAVLIHELAHIKRADLGVNCVQTVLQVIYFYNPLVWLANAIVRRVREQAVDEMALVALGAEARSYGNTLIDIAEMAFGRASPALRLIGVAESKKSLEGRIRHMITRPIPKNAKVGATGALAIAVVGALVLPMAAARTESEKAKFVAHLPGGATVELVGVCNWPTPEPMCWRPDGSQLEPPLRVTKWNQRPGANSYGFILKITGPEDLKRSWRKIEGAVGWEASCDVVNRQGNRLDQYTAAIALFEKARPQTTVEVGLAAGPWKTIATNDDKDRMWMDHSGVLWSQAFETSEGASIVVSTAWDKTVAHRVVAIDTEGQVHTTQQAGSIASGPVEQFTASFPGLTRGRIRQFQYQVRPFAWAVFEGVSLQPGGKTSPQVQPSSQPTVVRSPGAGDAPTGTVPSSTEKKHDSLPNIFILSPSRPAFDVFGQVIAQAGEWTWNKTGRDHAKKSYDEIFDGTQRRTDHDVLVLIFALDREDRIPAEYEDLLPRPWARIQEQLQRGEIVELSGKARDLNVVVLAAPRMDQLKQAIADSHVLRRPQDLLGSRGQGCDVAIENCRIVAVPERGTYEAHVSIRNRGRVASPQFAVSFYLGDPRATKPLLHGAGPIRPGEVWNESSGSFGLKEGINQVYIVLDPANLMAELDESNNRVLLTTEVHDGQIVKQATAPAAARGNEPKADPIR